MQSGTIFILVLMIFGPLSLSCKPTSESDLNLVNGKLDDEGLFPSVVQTAVKIGQTANGFIEAKCTASIISSQVVLTAAHCVTVKDKNPSDAINGELLANNGSGRNPYSLTYSSYTSDLVPTAAIAATSADVVIGDKRVKGGRVVMHPRYPGNSGPDVAMVTFPEGTFKDHKHMKVASGAENYPKEGLEVVIVGFGKTDQFDPNSGGEKRYGKNILRTVDSTLNFQGQTRTSNADGTNVFNSQGDSGGPMISNAGASKGMIIGVSSTQDQVQEGDTQGIGHYTNLLEESSERFLAQYTKEGQTIDLPSIVGNASAQSDSQNFNANQREDGPIQNENSPFAPPSYQDSYSDNSGFGANSYFHNNGCICKKYQ
jgi:hypothetical protein